jgi:DNA processing protein
MEPRELLALALNRAGSLRPGERYRLLDSCADPEALLSLPAEGLSRMLGRRVPAASWRPSELRRWAERERSGLTRAGFVCTFYWDEAFPSLLKEIFDPPVVLYVRGTLPGVGRELVAVVGTRRPTGVARDRAYELGFELARAGIGVVSGLARGIDAEAHRGAVDGGGYTLGVLGSGIDRVSPSSSLPLARRILERGGALVSEYPRGVPPEAAHFPARNRIISGMARSVVVIQAPERSGALITAEYALEQDRDLLVHAVGLCGAAGAGTRSLWQQGAPVVRSAANVLAALGKISAPSADVPARRTAGSSGPGDPGGREKPGSSREWGRELARRMELELAGKITVRGDRMYRKVDHGSE